MKYLCLFVLLLLHFVNADATHIIGGSLSYQHIWSNGEHSMYRIRLEVLRDCLNGAPNAPFDDPVHLGLFGDPFSHSIIIPFSGNDDTLNVNDINNICHYGNVCVHKTVYDTLIILKSHDDYFISYQRCCRSQIIQNVVDPLNTGMTFFCYIPPGLFNSSPEFHNNFPYAVFSNTPFVYDASATDPDGDSLAYELTYPFAGGSISNPQPTPPPPPPYDSVLLRPPYSLENMLGGYPLTINPTTGEMIAIPNLTGVFQIAYAVKEYRNGELIATTYREFAFVVTPPLPAQNYDVSGLVYVNDFMPLDTGKVQIYERNISNDSLYLYLEQEIGPTGSYSFEDIPPGVFYIKATVGNSSIYYNQYLPTYFDSSAFWYEATPIYQCDTSQSNRDIYLIYAEPPGGILVMDGIVTHAGRNIIPVAGLDLLLADEVNNLIQLRTTNAEGYFKFENLDPGKYLLYADLVNSSIDNSHPPIIDLSNHTSLQVFLYEDSLSLQMPTGTIQVAPQKRDIVKLFPNPTSGEIGIQVDLPIDIKMNCEIFDANGHLILSQKIHTKQSPNIDVSFLSPGVYVVRLSNNDRVEVIRFLRN